MLCKHPEETAAALRRVREEAECVKLGGQSKIDSVYLPKQRYMFDVVVTLLMRRHTECSHIYIYAYGIQNLRICFQPGMQSYKSLRPARHTSTLFVRSFNQRRRRTEKFVELAVKVPYRQWFFICHQKCRKKQVAIKLQMLQV